MASSGRSMFRAPSNYGDGEGGIIFDIGKAGLNSGKCSANSDGYWSSISSSMFGSKPNKVSAGSLDYTRNGGGVEGLISSIISQRGENDFSAENLDNDDVDVPPPPIAFLQSSVLAKFMNQPSIDIHHTNGAVIAISTSKQSLTSIGSGEQWAAFMAISYSILLIVLTGLVATLFAQQSSHANSLVRDSRRKSVSLISQGWIITSGDCKFLFDGACVPMSDGIPNEAALGGIMDERERKAYGMFSSINAPFLCLAACVISTAFSLCLIPSSDQNVKRMMKMMSILVVVVFGVLFCLFKVHGHCL